MALTKILDKVSFALMAAKNKTNDAQTLSTISKLSAEHTDNTVLGRVFGYSVSDYAIASLRWIGTKESMEIFDTQYKALPSMRKRDIDNLIKREIYKEL